MNFFDTFEDLFTATALALGPSPRDANDHAMTKYQLDLLEFWKAAGVRDLDLVYSVRKPTLTAYFAWEAKNEPRP